MRHGKVSLKRATPLFLGVLVLASVGQSAHAQAEDQTDEALRVFQTVCLATLPRHSNVQPQIDSIATDWEVESLPQLYTNFYRKGMQIEVSDDHPLQDQFFCNVSVAQADRKRLAAELPGLVQSVTGESPKAGTADFDYGSWRILSDEGIVHFGAMPYQDGAVSGGATLTIVRNDFE